MAVSLARKQDRGFPPPIGQQARDKRDRTRELILCSFLFRMWSFECAAPALTISKRKSRRAPGRTRQNHQSSRQRLTGNVVLLQSQSTSRGWNRADHLVETPQPSIWSSQLPLRVWLVVGSRTHSACWRDPFSSRQLVARSRFGAIDRPLLHNSRSTVWLAGTRNFRQPSATSATFGLTAPKSESIFRSQGRKEVTICGGSSRLAADRMAPFSTV